jgi:hypothetical protein
MIKMDRIKYFNLVNKIKKLLIKINLEEYDFAFHCNYNELQKYIERGYKNIQSESEFLDYWYNFLINYEQKEKEELILLDSYLNKYKDLKC